jgi:hypothetical protein
MGLLSEKGRASGNEESPIMFSHTTVYINMLQGMICLASMKMVLPYSALINPD